MKKISKMEIPSDPEDIESVIWGRRKSSKPRAKVPTESQEQAAVIQWWDRYAATKGIDPRLLFAIPNGAHLAGSEKLRGFKMHRMKQEGLRVGMPDLMLACRRESLDCTGAPITIHAGLFLEMKRVKGSKVSRDQFEMSKLLIEQGYRVRICYGADDAIAAIQNYLAYPSSA